LNLTCSRSRLPWPRVHARVIRSNSTACADGDRFKHGPNMSHRQVYLHMCESMHRMLSNTLFSTTQTAADTMAYSPPLDRCLPNGSSPSADQSRSTVSVTDVLRERDLSERAARALEFLRVVDQIGDILYHPDVVKLAVARYEHLWLPLCKSLGAGALPRHVPIDVALVWHTHVVCPQRYEIIPHCANGYVSTSSGYNGCSTSRLQGSLPRSPTCAWVGVRKYHDFVCDVVFRQRWRVLVGVRGCSSAVVSL
jgi:Glycine-rich domain-containing protein-like